MCKQKFKLSLLFFIFFLFFLFSNGHPQPLALLFCFLIAVGLWGLEEYWKHRSFGKARPLFLGSLIFLGICLLLPVFSFCIVLPAFILFYGLTYILLLLINRFLFIQQKVPSRFALLGMGALFLLCGVCSCLF